MSTTREYQEHLRARLRDGRPAAPEPWRPPGCDSFRQFRHVLAFDATLTNCGWAQLMVAYGKVVVIARGTIRPETGETGYLATWDKAGQLYRELAAVIGKRTAVAGPKPHIVVEAPSVGGGHRTESSLIAGGLVWMASEQQVTAVSATHVSAVLLGDARIRSEQRKRAIKEAVVRLCPEAAGRTWDEHQRDAVATGLTYLHDTLNA